QMRVGAENQRIRRAPQNIRQQTPLLVPLTSSSEINSDESGLNTPVAAGLSGGTDMLRRRVEQQQQQRQRQRLRRLAEMNLHNNQRTGMEEDPGGIGLLGTAATEVSPNRRRVFAHIAGRSPLQMAAATENSSSGGALALLSPAATAPAGSDSDSEDNGYDIDQYLDTQMMMLPPTPPRRRAPESESDTDLPPEDSGAFSPTRDASVGAGVATTAAIDRQPLLSQSTETVHGGEAETRRTLHRFSQMTHQRFLDRQRSQRETSPPATPVVSSSATAPATQAGGGGGAGGWLRFRMGADVLPSASHERQNEDDVDASSGFQRLTPPEEERRDHVSASQYRHRHFPSNDVDSYWYNQQEAAAAAAAAVATQDQQQLLESESPIQRDLVAAFEELRRRVMLTVLRAHRTLDSENNTDELDSEMHGHSSRWSRDANSERSTNIELHDLQRQLEFLRGHLTQPSVQSPGWLVDARAEKPETVVDGAGAEAQEQASGGRHAGSARTLIEERLVKWLTRNTVRVRDLSCALLRPGMRFRGVQKITPGRNGSGRRRTMVADIEQWEVDVVVQTVDMKRGLVAGLMRAIDVPWMPRAVTTSWEGEIVDFVNHSPATGKWRASATDDQQHWSLFAAVRDHPETFLQRWPQRLWGRRMPRVLEDYVFMRWKESAFVNVEQSETGLSIEGFYYICMQRTTGRIEGVYFDPSTQPHQRLSLQAENGGRCLAFAATGCC
ncbi:hypothetical protein EV175_003472, partial [Coemansia sp. RSA 1933]